MNSFWPYFWNSFREYFRNSSEFFWNSFLNFFEMLIRILLGSLCRILFRILLESLSESFSESFMEYFLECFSESWNSELFHKSSLLHISNIFLLLFSDWAIRLNQFRNWKDSWSNVSHIKNLHSCQCLPYLCSVVVIKKKIFC